MLKSIIPDRSDGPWSMDQWACTERTIRQSAMGAGSETSAWRILATAARTVLRTYSTSFFIVTRFLPPEKRAQVEAIYAAVRYPDEIVDTFPLSPEERLQRLQCWASAYEQGLECRSIKQALCAGVPSLLVGFTTVVRDCNIPREYYRSFIDAMCQDAHPRRYTTLSDLIDSYIYGSAIVVGYFLAHVYGTAPGREFTTVMQSARDLGIALQLTNFLRDVAEDQRRGRIYLPLEMLHEEGIEWMDANDTRQHPAINRVVRRVASVAEEHYQRSLATLDAFSPDCRTAIHSCIKVYRRLNERIGTSSNGILHRETVPMTEKFRVLPISKYWRLPAAYLMS